MPILCPQFSGQLLCGWPTRQTWLHLGTCLKSWRGFHGTSASTTTVLLCVHNKNHTAPHDNKHTQRGCDQRRSTTVPCLLALLYDTGGLCGPVMGRMCCHTAVDISNPFSHPRGACMGMGAGHPCIQLVYANPPGAHAAGGAQTRIVGQFFPGMLWGAVVCGAAYRVC